MFNVCAIDSADAVCTSRNADTVASGFHILQNDLPFAVSGRSYQLVLPMGSPGCNSVTASPACVAAALE